MPWGDNSGRTVPLPPNWANIRAQVRARAGGICEQCGDRGTDCDHIGDPADHRLVNLQWLCRRCHTAATQADNRARLDKRKHPNNRPRRPDRPGRRN